MMNEWMTREPNEMQAHGLREILNHNIPLVLRLINDNRMAGRAAIDGIRDMVLGDMNIAYNLNSFYEREGDLVKSCKVLERMMHYTTFLKDATPDEISLVTDGKFNDYQQFKESIAQKGMEREQTIRKALVKTFAEPDASEYFSILTDRPKQDSQGYARA